MKQTLLLFMFCLGFINLSNGQEIPTNPNQTPQELYDFHISKKKANNLAGWLTLGGGVAMFIGGISQGTDYIIDYLNPNKEEKKSVEWLVYGGGAVMLASIPLFIASGKHKQKAKIQLQQGAVGLNNNINYSGLSISLSF